MVSPNGQRLRSTLAGVVRNIAARLGHQISWPFVTFLVTLRCNQRCSYCDFPNWRGPEVDTEGALLVLRELRNRAGTVRLGVSGGEPLLRQDLGQILFEANRLGFVISLVTNGTKLQERVEDCLMADYILATADGDETSHDAVRGKGAFRAMVRGLYALRSHPKGAKKHLGLICPVHIGNRHAIEEPLRLAEELGARVYYQPVQHRQSGFCHNDSLSDDELRAIFARIAAWKRASRPVGNSLRYLQMVASGARETSCSAGKWFVTILPDTRVLPCCILPFDLAVPLERALTMGGRLEAHCNGCTISPYMETNLLLRPDPLAWLEVLRWR